MEWRIKFEARSGWGEVETIEVPCFKWRIVGLTAEEIGLSLEEASQVLAEISTSRAEGCVDEIAICDQQQSVGPGVRGNFRRTQSELSETTCAEN